MDVGINSGSINNGSKVLESLAELETAKTSLLTQVAGSISTAGHKAAADSSLTEEEITRRFDAATAILRGDTQAPDVSISGSTALARPEYTQVFNGEYSTLEQRPGIYGKLELRFTLKGGLQNLKAACDEINQSIKSANNYPKKGFRVYLSGNDYPNLPKNEDIIIEFTPVIYDSGERERYGDDSLRSHEALAKNMGLEMVPNDIARLAAGAFRKEAGFPKNSDNIGTTRDAGDIFEGNWARTERGSRSGGVASYLFGVDDIGWVVDFADDFLVLAGASPRNQKT